MFHSVGRQFGVDGHVLRKTVSTFLANNLELPMHEQSLRNWIEWDYNKKAEFYTEELKRGLWGGALEITILASLLKVPIFVYVIRGGFCEKLTVSNPDKTFPTLKVDLKEKYLCLIWDKKSHYMILHCKDSS
jgi:hypothetical protein